MDAPPLESGACVERYEVLGLLGEGGLARVYRVRHTQLGTIHALKLLTLRRNGLAERLLLEGRIQAQLRHPNVVAVSDVVQHEGQPGLIIEFVEGPTLEDWLRQEGPPSVAAGLSLFSQVLAGVRAAHLVGVLHRDLKPANILLQTSRNGAVTPKVADFGIAKVALESAGESPAGATRVGAAMGTPGYMAPEQFNDASGVDVRADIFALGTILYEILTGRPTFTGATLLETLNAVAKGLYLPLEDLNSQVPAHVVAAVKRAVAPDPADRFATCDAFAEAVFATDPDLRDRVIEAMPAGPVELSRRGVPPVARVAQPPAPATPSPNRGTVASATMVQGDPAPATMLPDSLDRDLDAPPVATRDRRPLVLLLVGAGAVGLGLLLFLAVGLIGTGGWLASQSGSSGGSPATVQPSATDTPATGQPASGPGAVDGPGAVVDGAPTGPGAGVGGVEAGPAAASTTGAGGSGSTPGSTPSATLGSSNTASGPGSTNTGSPPASANTGSAAGSTSATPAAVAGGPSTSASGARSAPTSPSANLSSSPATGTTVASTSPATSNDGASPSGTATGGTSSPSATSPSTSAAVATPTAAAPVDITGTWTGRWNGRPLTLRVSSQSGSAVRARVEVLLGTTPRGWTATGTFDGTKLALTGDDGFVMSGTLSGGRFSGTIAATGQKTASWDGGR